MQKPTQDPTRNHQLSADLLLAVTTAATTVLNAYGFETSDDVPEILRTTPITETLYEEPVLLTKARIKLAELLSVFNEYEESID